MLKEIPGVCTLHEAAVIYGLTGKYAVTVETAPYTPRVVTPATANKDTQIIIKELQEGVIAALFFGDMYKLLQENPEPVIQEVPVVITQPVAETAPTTSPIKDAPTVTIWSRFMSFLKPDETKQLTNSDQGAH